MAKKNSLNRNVPPPFVIFAYVLFILLPFIGFLAGMVYQEHVAYTKFVDEHYPNDKQLIESLKHQK